MHERTRRLICRLVFVVLCAGPTAGLSVWVAVAHSSIYQAACRRQWQQALSQQWGLVVTLDRLHHPRRGSTVLERVRAADPETGELLVEVRQIELAYVQDELVAVAAQPEVQGEHLWRLWEAFHERFLRSEAGSRLRVRLRAGEVTIHRADGSGGTTLANVHCQIAPDPNGPQATFEFLDAALQMAEPAQLRVTRNRQISPPATRWELNTRSTSLPCSILADQLPALHWLGDEAAFQGTVDAVRSAGGWQGDVTGRFCELDLERLVTERYDHKLSGTAELRFTRARFENGKLADAAGDLVARGGWVSRSLLAQADLTLGVVADPRVRALEADMLWRYRELNFGFAISAQGLKIAGHCPGEGVVMSDTYGPLLSDKPREIAQVVGLVHTLASSHGQQVPASAEAYQLLHVLPIPSRDDRPSLATPGSLYAPLRLQTGSVDQPARFSGRR